jgi:hypothetical protein
LYRCSCFFFLPLVLCFISFLVFLSIHRFCCDCVIGTQFFLVSLPEREEVTLTETAVVRNLSVVAYATKKRKKKKKKWPDDNRFR